MTATFRVLLTWSLLWSLSGTALAADSPQIAVPSTYGEPAGTEEKSTEKTSEQDQIRATAIALNYCRASFHRIRKYPVKPVLAEEQEKILNNLNLQRIEDPEVIQLYTSVLDEINQIEIADRERTLTKSNHRTNLQRKITWDVLAFSTDLATAQFGSAIKQGANSWWDYRNLTYQRDSALMKVEKSRMQSVTQKSSNFLDTFWKLARKKNIPDRWLVRGDDLDSLEAAYNEQNPEVRLRILKRMEPYMEAYPPYWYYRAKTEQELGALIAAADTYQHVARVGDGHFRKDDMLATSLANLAAIQDHLGHPESVRTAQRALEYSTDVWEANLICSRILERHGQIALAEDAILRNLDVELETCQSRVFLASLYYHADEKTKLARMLEHRDVVASLPAPVLLRCAACLGLDRTPPHVIRTVRSAINVQAKHQIGQDELMVHLSPAWQLHLARVEVSYRGRALQQVPFERSGEAYQLRYAGQFDFNPAAAAESAHPLAVSFHYPDSTVVQVSFLPEGSCETTTDRNAVGGLFSRMTTRPVGMSASIETLDFAEIAVNNAPLGLTTAQALPAPDSDVPVVAPF